MKTPDSGPLFGDQVVLQVVLHVWQVVLQRKKPAQGRLLTT
jgi:hypothetical protein